MRPELHRPVAIESIGPAGLDSIVEANAGECAALAARMKLPAILSLTCQFHLKPAPNGAFAARGRLQARVVQTCVVSLEEFESTVAEAFTVLFVAEQDLSQEFDPDAEDEIPFQNGVLDLGEAAAEQLALALDPYPRQPGVELPEQPSGSTESPLARLASLRQRH